VQQVLLRVCGWEDLQWEMMHVGKCHRIKQVGHQKDKKVHEVIKHTEKQFQKNTVLGKNIVVDESTVGFNRKIIFKS
jgi:RecJ-like exonuclease